MVSGVSLSWLQSLQHKCNYYKNTTIWAKRLKNQLLFHLVFNLSIDVYLRFVLALSLAGIRHPKLNVEFVCPILGKIYLTKMTV